MMVTWINLERRKSDGSRHLVKSVSGVHQAFCAQAHLEGCHQFRSDSDSQLGLVTAQPLEAAGENRNGCSGREVAPVCPGVLIRIYGMQKKKTTWFEL